MAYSKWKADEAERERTSRKWQSYCLFITQIII